MGFHVQPFRLEMMGGSLVSPGIVFANTAASDVMSFGHIAYTDNDSDNDIDQHLMRPDWTHRNVGTKPWFVRPGKHPTRDA